MANTLYNKAAQEVGDKLVAISELLAPTCQALDKHTDFLMDTYDRLEDKKKYAKLNLILLDNNDKLEERTKQIKKAKHILQNALEWTDAMEETDND